MATEWLRNGHYFLHVKHARTFSISLLTSHSATSVLMMLWLALKANSMSKSRRSETGISRRIGCKEEGRSCVSIAYTAYPPPSGPPPLLPLLPLRLARALESLGAPERRPARAQQKKRTQLLLLRGPPPYLSLISPTPPSNHSDTHSGSGAYVAPIQSRGHWRHS